MSLERTLHRDYYVTDAIFAREQELALPGEWLARKVAGESLLLVRTRDGSLAGHYNVCRHRGARLVPECGRGRFAGTIRCPYHSWTYGVEGALRTAPFLEEGQGLTKAELALHRRYVGERLGPRWEELWEKP